MSFHVKDLIFEKNIDGDICITLEDGTMFVLTKDDWISIITEMSYKPENADQYKLAEEFHLGKK